MFGTYRASMLGVKLLQLAGARVQVAAKRNVQFVDHDQRLGRP